MAGYDDYAAGVARASEDLRRAAQDQETRNLNALVTAEPQEDPEDPEADLSLIHDRDIGRREAQE